MSEVSHEASLWLLRGVWSLCLWEKDYSLWLAWNPLAVRSFPAHQQNLSLLCKAWTTSLARFLSKTPSPSLSTELQEVWTKDKLNVRYSCLRSKASEGHRICLHCFLQLNWTKGSIGSWWGSSSEWGASLGWELQARQGQWVQKQGFMIPIISAMRVLRTSCVRQVGPFSGHPWSMRGCLPVGSSTSLRALQGFRLQEIHWTRIKEHLPTFCWQMSITHCVDVEESSELKRVSTHTHVLHQYQSIDCNFNVRTVSEP